MMSLVAKRFDDAKAGQPVRLFKSHRDGHRRRRAAARLHLCRRCGRGGALADGDAAGVGHFQCRHRQGAQLSRSDLGDVPRARARSRTSNTSTCRTTSATSTSISREAKVDNLRRAGYNAGFTPLEDGVHRYVTAVPRHRRPLSLRPGHHVRFRKTARGHRRADHPLHRRPDARRLRLWRRVAHLARGAGAGDPGRAARMSSSAAPATWRATSPASARNACSSASSATTMPGEILRPSSASDKAGDHVASGGRSSRPTTRKVRFVSEHYLDASAARRLGAGAAGRRRRPRPR